MPLLSGDAESIERSQQLLSDYDTIIAESGCGSACATKLLQMYGITPREFHMSEFSQVAGKTPPFKSEEIDKLLSDHLENATNLILNYSEEVTDKETVNEVILGADKTVRIGGGSKKENMNKPVVMFEVFDKAPPLPAAVKKVYKDKTDDPIAWAKCCVEDFGAEMVCIELISTSPYTQDRTADEAVKVITKILNAIDVPIMIGGSGEIDKDIQVLAAVAKAASGRRCLLSSITLDNYQGIIPSAIEYNHAVLAATTMSLETAMAFNRDITKMGLSLESIIMDLSTCPLGYGYEYSYSLVERCKLGAFGGNKLAQPPVFFCPANSWAARESRAKVPEWGDPKKRGSMWEMVAAIGGLMAGADLLLMLDPTAITNTRTFIDEVWKCK